MLAIPALLIPALPPATAQEAPAAPSQEEIQAYFGALVQPGKEHALLAGLAGDWNMTIKMWGKPGMEPIVSTAKGRNHMILEGRFLQTATVGELFNTKTESLTLMGFDRRSDEYTLVGFDTMGTYYVTGAGGYDAETKTMTLKGISEHPKFGITETYAFVIKLVSDDEYVTSILFDQPDGSQFKMVELTHRRAK
jgi:hypothetical protein